MNARAASRKCANAQQALEKEQAKSPPRNMPSPMGWLFPLVPVVPATKAYVERWEANRAGKIAKLRQEADHWCQQAQILAQQEAEERRILTQQLEQLGPAAAGGGRGAGDVALDLLESGLDVGQGLVGGTQQAPASQAAIQRARQQRNTARTRRAVGTLATLAIVGTAGYVGYRYWRSR